MASGKQARNSKAYRHSSRSCSSTTGCSNLGKGRTSDLSLYPLPQLPTFSEIPPSSLHAATSHSPLSIRRARSRMRIPKPSWPLLSERQHFPYIGRPCLARLRRTSIHMRSSLRFRAQALTPPKGESRLPILPLTVLTNIIQLCESVPSRRSRVGSQPILSSRAIRADLDRLRPAQSRRRSRRR